MVSLVAADALRFAWGGAEPCVRDVSIQLAPGELLALCGPNAAGKSTLLKLLGGTLRPQAGSVSLSGRALDELPASERALAVARVPQSLRGLPDSSVRHFVLGGRYAHVGSGHAPRAADHAAVAAALARFDLGAVATRPLATLSGGQRQRALLARALASEAPVLLVDEPTNALDPAHQLSTLAQLRELADAGHGVLVVTHDLGLAGQFAHRLALLQDGRLVATGTPEEVLCREVLEPVYGDNLHYGRMPEPDGRRFVLPWRPRSAASPDAAPRAGDSG